MHMKILSRITVMCRGHRSRDAEQTLKAAWIAVETHGDRPAIEAIRRVVADSNARLS